jgi:hypothetical protein
MSGFLAGGIVSLILTVVGVVAIMYSRTINGMASVSIIQAAMLVKLMLAGTFTMALIKLAPFEINLWAYAITLGTYSCVGSPIIAYYIMKQDFTQ